MSQLAPVVSEKPVRKRNARDRLRTLESVDGRIEAAKRVRDLTDRIEAELSMQNVFPITETQRQLVRRAAMLSVVVEDIEARTLAGEPAADYVTTVNAQRRAFEALGLTHDAAP